MAFGAVSDIWFVIIFTMAFRSDYIQIPMVHQNLPLIMALFLGVVIAIGLFAYGAALNDLLDVRQDSTFAPDRPIPAGRIRASQATVVTIGALIVAVLGGAGLGTWAVCLTLLAATGLLFYNATGKYIPSVGIVTIGLVHVVHMLIPNHDLMFTLPVWLVMTHSMVIICIVHVWEDKRPRLNRRAMIAVVLGWLVWSVVILGASAISEQGMWPNNAPPTGILYPVLAIVSFALIAWMKTSSINRIAAAEKLKRYGAMWQSLYGAAWLLAVGLTTPAIWLGLFAVVGFLGMTLIKELSGHTGRPITYRG